METEFGFIGWSTVGTSDKIWGYFFRPTPDRSSHAWKNNDRNVVIFWAARGKSMRFKADMFNYDLEQLQRSKLKKGYVNITEARFLEIWPTFESEKDAKLMWEVLAGNVK